MNQPASTPLWSTSLYSSPPQLYRHPVGSGCDLPGFKTHVLQMLWDLFISSVHPRCSDVQMLVQLHVWMLTAPHLPFWKLQERQTWSLWKKWCHFHSQLMNYPISSARKGLALKCPLVALLKENLISPSPLCRGWQ